MRRRLIQGVPAAALFVGGLVGSLAPPGVAGIALAQAPPADDLPPVGGDDGWRFSLAPYFWLAAMDGEVTVGGQTASVSQDFGDVVDTLSDYLNFGAAFHFEGERGRAGFLTDVMYMELRAERPAPGGSVREADIEQLIAEFGGFFILHDSSAGDGGPGWRIDALAGLRYIDLDVEIQPGGTPVSRSRDWVDPFVGARFAKDFNGWLRGHVRADIGGFESGGSSDLTWSVTAGLGFKLSPAVTLDVGYKVLSYDYETGSGTNRFEYDMMLNGPYLGLQIRF